MAELLREVPELADTYRDHQLANDEILPHVLMGDVTRFALKVADSGTRWSQDMPILARLLAMLDNYMASGSRDVQELIAVSFLENLDETDPGYRALTRAFGPALSHEMTRLHGGDPW